MTVSHPPPARVFVGTQVTSLAALPFAPPAPAGGEGRVAHRLLGASGWSQDAQSYLVSCLDLTLTFPPGLAAPAPTPSVAEVAAWRAPARVTALAAAAPAPGAALLVAACADGSLCRLRLHVPTAPGAGVEDAGLIDAGGADHAGDALVPWRPAAHAGAATAVDIGPAGVVSGGADGAIVVTPADAPRGGAGDGAAAAVAPPRPTAAVVDVRCRTQTDVVAVGAGGGVELWDTRVRPSAGGARPAARAPPPPSPAAAPVRVAVTPARPHAVAVGLRDGGVALLDVRALTKGAVADAALPPSAAGGRPEGPVTALAFDPLPTLAGGGGHAGGGRGGPALLFTTATGGALASAPLVGRGEAAAPLFREPAGGATALALDGGGVDAVVATAHEGLVYMSRR